MPQKDYVKASRPKAKPANRRPARKNSNASSGNTAKPWLLLIVTALLISGFVYFLWFLNQQPAAPAPAAKPEKTVKQDELPAKPTTEPYQYIKELENKEIQVTVEELEAKGPFLMFCGTYRAIETAQQMKAKVAFAGYPSEVRRIEGKNGVFFRVTLGPYTSKRQAESDRSRLMRQKVVECRIAVAT